MKISYGEKREANGFQSGSWQRYVTLENGRMFNVSIAQGRRVRIPYKPRGENIGFEWHAYCTECTQDKGARFPTTVKRFPVIQVNKSTGVRGVLKYHEII